jgi:hypothetical protein
MDFEQGERSSMRRFARHALCENSLKRAEPENRRIRRRGRAASLHKAGTLKIRQVRTIRGGRIGGRE